MKYRTLNIPTVAFQQDEESKESNSIAVMFSGGLDSSILAALLLEVLDSKICVDLINVSFAPDTSADRITSIYSYYELKK